MKWLKVHKETIPRQQFINELSFQKVFDRVNELAQKLDEVTKQEIRIGILAENNQLSAIFIMALLLLKKEVLLLNNRLKRPEIEKQTKMLGVNQIYSSREEYIAFRSVDHYPSRYREFDWTIDPEQIAVIMYTSATSGTFKAVPIRWSQIQAHVLASAKALGTNRQDNWLLTLPLFHVSGLSILLRSLFNGTSVTIIEKFDEASILAMIKEKKINMISLVPTLLVRIVDEITDHGLRVVLLGGEYISPRLIRKCIAQQIPVYKSYGMTEAMSQLATFLVLDYPDKLDAAGKPLFQVEVSIADADEAGVGEICVKGPVVMSGYLGKDKISNFFHTGDIGYIDPDGFLYVLNRRRDIIISGGENIYPKEIEDLLYQQPQIKECAVVGISDERWGQQPVLFLVSDMSEISVRQCLEAKLAGYKIPKKIFYRSALPRNANGKLVRKHLEEDAYANTKSGIVSC